MAQPISSLLLLQVYMAHIDNSGAVYARSTWKTTNEGKLSNGGHNIML